MENRSKADIALFAKLSRHLISHHFPKKKFTIKPLRGGLTNYVYAVHAGSDSLVVRISDKPEKIHFFQKEQWAVAKAKEKEIPVPDILEVGNDIIPHPYMISRKIEGEEATHHKCRWDIIQHVGRYAAMIHSIPTKGFGHIFDWSQNTLSKNDSWKDYMERELNVDHRMKLLTKHKILPDIAATRIKKELNKMRKWDLPTCLHHGDLRLKNIMVNKAGDITAIIDWENCISSMGPYWDTSIALHDLSIEAQCKYLDGYAFPHYKLKKMMPAIKVFNFINYAPEIERIIRQKDKTKLDRYKLRLQGVLDLFSL